MKIKIIGTVLLGLFMMFVGLLHYFEPQIFYAYIPAGLSKSVVNTLAGVLEFTLGICLIIPKTRNTASLVILLIMIGYLPIHIYYIVENNFTTSIFKSSYLRIPFQLFLIGWSYWIWKDFDEKEE